MTQQFPGMEVLGTSYPIPAHKVISCSSAILLLPVNSTCRGQMLAPFVMVQAAIAKMVTAAQFGAIGFMLAGEQVCGALGVPVPELYQQYKEKKSGIILAIWFLGNALHNQLTATGAFEVYYDGQLVRTAQCLPTFKSHYCHALRNQRTLLTVL